MQRKIVSLICALFALAVLNGRAAEPPSSANPVNLKPGVYLFLDDQLIEQSSNVVRKINSPTRDLAQPIVTGKEDNNFQPYVTVLRDPGKKRFRMWYDIPQTLSQSHLGYMESRDGVQWIRPHRVLGDSFTLVFGASVMDDGENSSDLSRRFKFVGYSNGLCVAFSPDGLRWTAEKSNPVLKGVNDITHLIYDPARQRYLCVFGFPSRKEDGYIGHTQNSTEGYRRCVGQSVSADCVHWEKPRRIFAPDKKDAGITEFYSVGGILARGETLVGLLKVLRDDFPCDQGGKTNGIGYTVLAWSHDGENWERDREPFFDRNPTNGSWDHAMSWMDYQLPIGDEVFIYYGGYARGHKVERATERQLGLVRMKRDRYVAREVGESPGILRTRLLKFSGTALTANVDSSGGNLIAQIEDEKNHAIRGYAFSDFTPVETDSLSAPLKWKKPLENLNGKNVRIVFKLSKARLFAMQFD